MATATLSWTNPTSRTDGVALSPDEIASVDIFDSAETDPTQPIGRVPGAGTSFTTGLLTVGTHGFTAVVNDVNGHKSAPSNSAVAIIEATQANPAAITDLSVVVNP